LNGYNLQCNLKSFSEHARIWPIKILYLPGEDFIVLQIFRHYALACNALRRVGWKQRPPRVSRGQVRTTCNIRHPKNLTVYLYTYLFELGFKSRSRFENNSVIKLIGPVGYYYYYQHHRCRSDGFRTQIEINVLVWYNIKRHKNCTKTQKNNNKNNTRTSVCRAQSSFA